MAPGRRSRRTTSESVEVPGPVFSEVEGSERNPTGLFAQSSRGPPRWPVAPDKLKNHVDYSLFRSYTLPPQKRQLPRRQRRWRHNGPEPITDMKDVPEGWNPNDLDIDENDIDGQIARCLERIQDGIMPQVFQCRLEMYEKMKAAREKMIRSEPEGLNWDVIQRLDMLKMIETHVSKEGDPDDQLPNIRALIAAYRSGNLNFKSGMVTYWSKGKQLNSPQEFNEGLHESMRELHDTTRSWWVEGLSGTRPANMGQLMSYPPYNPQHAVMYRVDVSGNCTAPNPNGFSILAVHDTGADMMAIPHQNMNAIKLSHPGISLQGYTVMNTPGDMVCNKVYEIDVTMPGWGPAMTGGQGPWMRIQVSELRDIPGAWPGSILSGPFIRFMYYTATCPNGQGYLYVTDYRDDLGTLAHIPPGYATGGPGSMTVQPPSPGGGPPTSLTTKLATASQAPATPSLKRSNTPTQTGTTSRKKTRKAGP